MDRAKSMAASTTIFNELYRVIETAAANNPGRTKPTATKGPAQYIVAAAWISYRLAVSRILSTPAVKA